MEKQRILWLGWNRSKGTKNMATAHNLTVESHESPWEAPVAEQEHSARVRGACDRRGQVAPCPSQSRGSRRARRKRPNKPSASDVGAKALLFTTSAQLTSLASRHPLRVSATQTKPWACNLGFLPNTTAYSSRKQLHWMTTGRVPGDRKAGPC